MDPPANRFTKLQQSFFFSLYTRIPVYPHSPLRFPYQFPFLSRLKRKKLSSSLQLPYQREFDCISNRTVAMNSRRDYRGNRSALFDGIEEGGIRASSSYSSHEIDEHDNDNALDGLQDRVIMLKRLTGDIHEEVESHNHMLDGMGNEMDSSRGILSGTMDRFKTVFEKKSSRRMATLVASFVVIFLIVYYLTR